MNARLVVRGTLLTLSCLLIFPRFVLAQPLDAKVVDALVEEAMKAWKVPGAAIAIIKDDKVVYLKGFGVRERGKSEPVTPDTLFAIASTSKAFTTTAMAMLVDDGKMSWDDPVRKHIEFFRLADPLAEANVTLRDLVCHRTGLSRNDLLWYNSPWNREEILHKIGHVRLTQPYRSMFQYQNIMYLAAGYAVGTASKSSWEAFVQKRIFDPLGMTGANFSTLVAEKAADHARPHRKLKDGKIETLASWRNVDHIAPAGSINAGVRDLSKWVRFQLGDGTFEGKRLLSAAQLAELQSPQMVIPMDGPTGVPSFSKAMNPETNLMCYGLGWVIQDYRGQLLVAHGGSLDGFRAQVALVPKAKLGIAILSNLGRTQMPEALRNNLVDHLLNLEKKDWNAHYLEQAKKLEDEQRQKEDEREAKRHKDTKPSRELAAYAGTYAEPAYDKVKISVEGGALVLRWSKFQVRLEHFHFDTFRVAADQVPEDSPLHKVQIVFGLGSDGEVTRLRFLEQELVREKGR